LNVSDKNADNFTLQETELGYREARYLQRQEQKRERQTIIARIEAVNHRIEQEKQLFEAERVRLVALLESQEVKQSLSDIPGSLS
jgi:hypothetical protein